MKNLRTTWGLFLVFWLTHSAGLASPPIYYSLDEALMNPNEVRHLDLSHSGLTTVSPRICSLSALEVLDISHNSISRLPEELSQLTQLNTLILSHNSTIEAPRLYSVISQLEKLRYLDLSACNLRYISGKLGQLSLLETLHLAENGLITLPEQLSQLEALTDLSLKGNQLLAEQLRNTLPSNLHSIELSFNPAIEEFDTYIILKNLSSLRQLVAQGIEKVPLSFWSLNQLEQLDISNGQFVSLTPAPKSLKNLSTLILEDCNQADWSTLFVELSNIKSLRVLSVKNETMKVFPKGIERLKNLEALALKGKNWQGLPADIQKCRNLKSISFSHTDQLQLKILFDRVNLIRSLQSLHLKYCGISQIPTNIHLLQKLAEIDLTGNFLDESVIDLLETLLPKTTIRINNKVMNEEFQLKALSEWKEVTIDPKPSFVDLENGYSLQIPPNAILGQESKPVSKSFELKYRLLKDPVDWLTSAVPFLRQDTLEGKVLLSNFLGIQVKLPEEMNWSEDQPLKVIWRSSNGDYSIPVWHFRALDNSWHADGKDSRELEKESAFLPENATASAGIELPAPPVLPEALHQVNLKIESVKFEKKIAFKVQSYDQGDLREEDELAFPVLDYPEQGILKNVIWVCAGENPLDAQDQIARLSAVLPKTPLQEMTPGEGSELPVFLSNFHLSPDLETDQYRCSFDLSTKEKIELQAYPVFNNMDHSVEDPATDQRLNARFYTEYKELLDQRNRQWQNTKAQYQTVLSDYEQQMQQYRQSLSQISGMVAPGGELNSTEFKRIFPISDTTLKALGRWQALPGNSCKVILINEQGEAIYPSKMAILDKTSSTVLYTAEGEITFEPGHQNALVIPLENSIGLVTTEAFRKQKINSKTKLLMLEMKTIAMDGLTNERLKRNLGWYED